MAGRARSCIAPRTETIASSDALRHGLPVAVEHGRRGHEVADVAHQHQRPAAPARRAVPSRPDVAPVVGQPADEGAVALGDVGGEVTLHQAEPVAVGDHLVRTVDRGDGVLEVDDRGDGRLQDDVGDPGGVVGADGCARSITISIAETVVLQEQRGGVGRRRRGSPARASMDRRPPLDPSCCSATSGHACGVDAVARRRRRCEPCSSGTTSSRKARTQATTRAPRAGSYGPGSGRSPMASVP